MKTKRIWTIAAFMMMALFSVSFISCSDDDDDDTNAAIGIWEGYTSGVTWTLEFRGGGKGKECYIWNGEVAESHSFTYSMTGKFTGVMNFPDYKDGRFTFEIDGNTLRLYNEYSNRYDFTKKE